MPKVLTRPIGALAAVLLVAVTSLVLTAPAAHAVPVGTITLTGTPALGQTVTIGYDHDVEQHGAYLLFCGSGGYLSWATGPPGSQLGYADTDCGYLNGLYPFDANLQAAVWLPSYVPQLLGKYLYAAVNDVDGTHVAGPLGPVSDVVAMPPAPASDILPYLTNTTGPLMVGYPVSAQPVTWSDATSATVNWYRCTNRDTIPAGCALASAGDATNTTYQLSPDDFGYYMAAEYAATGPGGTTSHWTDTTNLTVQGAMVFNLVAPTITGTATVGGTLDADVGTWVGAPTIDAPLWQRCTPGDTASCVTVGSGDSHTVVEADFAQALRIMVDTHGQGRDDSAPSAMTDPVTGIAPILDSPPTLSGQAVDGGTLTVMAGTWHGTGSADFTYNHTWYVCDATGNGCQIAMDGADTWAVADILIGSTLKVVETVTGPAGTNTAEVLSALIAAAPPVATTAPSISGTALDGQTLQADPGQWSGTAPVTWTYQWLRCDPDGATCDPVTGQTGTTFDLGTADIGHRLTVRVTAHNEAGTVAQDASPTAVVAAVATPGAEIDSDVKVSGDTITVTGDGFAPHSTVHVVLHSDPVDLGDVLTDAHGHFSATFTLPAGVPAGDHHVVLSGLDAAGRPVTVTLAVTLVSADPPAGTPTDPPGDTSAPAWDTPVTAPASGPLPVTGSAVGVPLIVALALAITGTVLLAAARRRARHS